MILPNNNHCLEARREIQSLAASEIRKVANRAMGKPNILPFWFGESDQATPAFIRDAASLSLANGETFYSQNLGRPYLRQGIADYLTRLHGKAFDVDQIAVTGSGVSGLMLAAQMLVEPGDKLVAVTPLWPNVVEIPKILSARVERVPLDVKQGRWSLDLDKLLSSLTPDTRALLLNSPNNPTGWTIDQPSIDVIAAHCRKHGIWVISDDVYERLVFDPALKSAPSFLNSAEPDDRVISVNSFSKAWTMTGWRIGWMVVPPELSTDLAKVIEFNMSCVFEPIQRAAFAAVTEGDTCIEELRARLRGNREVLLNGLSSLPGIDVPDADGAMYAFFRIEGHPNSLDLATKLIDQVGLGLAPGGAFGPEGSEWLRWCHAVDVGKLNLGIDRLRAFLS
ncbi:pyridoxal phosphate-dependent aminotransferase [Pseudomonas kermanshahensis]|uniref:pyridoxal phosphate-dependent aminotransferase n=1 Tax=Pseudomonas kermanshahensis TaxID=2745482 RepID=UPI0023DA80CB|nr:pyridoxal phosphate-dependent aminotransferase [Pseudomonas kermanshahensis]WEL57547.1 pyridoxal phosphate-dependent aminotransferase [Pseudomonas kermanshahensis]